MDENQINDEKSTGAEHPNENASEKPMSVFQNMHKKHKITVISIVALIVILLAALGIKAYIESQKVIIPEDTPAVMLVRDDLEPPKDPKLFLNVSHSGYIHSNPVQGDPFDKPFLESIFTYNIDVNACVDYYGKGGLTECRNNWAFLDETLTPLTVSPPIDDSKVKWTSYPYDPSNPYRREMTLAIPSELLPSGTAYSYEPAKSLGKDVIVNKLGSLTLNTPEFRVDLRQGTDFLVDPNNPKNIYLTGSLNSSLPMVEEDVIKLFSITSEGDQNTVTKFGKPELTFNNSSTYASFNIPIVELPKYSRPAKVQLEKGVKRLGYNGKGKDQSQYKSSYGFNIPGQDVFVSLQGANTQIITDDELNSKQVVVLSFTRKIDTDKLSKSLKIKLLPQYRTDKDKERKISTDWQSIPVESIRAVDIKNSTPVEFKLIPSKDKLSDYVAISFEQEFGRYLYITLEDNGVKSDSAYNLHPFMTTQVAPSIAPEIRVMQDGSILNLGGSRSLAVFSRGMEDIEVKGYKVRPEFINLLVSKESTFEYGLSNYTDQGTYTVDELTNPRYISSLNFNDISEVYNYNYKPTNKNGVKPDYSSVDISKVVKDSGSGIFLFVLKGKDARDMNNSSSDSEYEDDYYDEGYDDYSQGSSNLQDSRFVLVTDMGITVKLAHDGSRDIFISSLSKGGPVAGAEVQVLGRNGVVLFSKLTNATGNVTLPKLAGFVNEQAPVAIVARKGNDLSYIALNDRNRSDNTLSSYSSSGRSVTKNGVQFFVFSERGIFLPGEDLRFGVVAKGGDWDGKRIEKMPYKATVSDPRGRKVYEKSFTINDTGLESITVPMQDGWPTGQYTLDILLKNNIVGSKAVQVEEFKPDNLKIYLEIAKNAKSTKGWLKPDEIQGEVEVRNLFGTPAVGNRISANMTVSRANLYFNEYSDYNFFDPNKSVSGYEDGLGSVVTNDDGKAVINVPLDDFSAGTYKVSLDVEAFEQGGGRSVWISKSALISSLDSVVGYRSAAALGFIAKDSRAVVDFIAIDSKLTPKQIGDLSIQINEITYLASLIKDNSGRFRYESVRQDNPIETRKNVTIGDQGLSFTLPTDKTGEFELILQNSKGTPLSRFNFVIAGGSDRRFGLERDATLRIHLDKQEYNAGDQMKVFISSPYAGSGLITIETDKVQKYEWFTAPTSDYVHTLTVPDSFEGRAFLNVSVVRDIKSDAVHSSPYTSASTSFIANIDKRNMFLEVEADEKIQPGEILDIIVTSETPGKAIVFAVNEGILQLTSYKTPSPIDFLLKNNALLVDTFRTMDLIMPEYYLLNMSAFGGDMMADMAASAANPFKRKSEPSVVYWSGLVDVDADGTHLEYKVPEFFNGTLRVIAIGASDTKVGESKTKSLIQGPMVITPDLPVAVAPGDEFEFTATVANNIEGSGKDFPINFNITLGDGLAFVGEPQKSIKVNEGREGNLVFKLKATDVLGESTVGLEAVANLNGQKILVRRPINLSVRPATPLMNSFRAGILKSEEVVVPVTMNLYPQYASLDTSLSGLPLPLVDALSTYLVKYPYGCTEQILSSAFPYAILHRFPELVPKDVRSNETPAEAQERAVAAINKGIVTLQDRQVSAGRFSLWPDQTYAQPFLTPFALDFLQSAKDAGFEVPAALLKNTQEQTAAMLMFTPRNEEEALTLAYAAWTYVRTGERFNRLPELIKDLDNNVKGWRKGTSAALLASCYKMMLQDKEANELIKGVDFNITAQKRYNNWFYNSLWDASLQLSVVAQNFPEMLKTPEAQRILVRVVNDIIGNNYTTNSSAQGIRGIISFAVSNMESKPNIVIEARDKDKNVLPLEATGDLVKRLTVDVSAKDFVYKGGKGLYWQLTEEGYQRTQPKASAKIINVAVTYLNADGVEVKEFNQGDEGYVLLSASAASYIDNVAITSLIPGGFEMVISKGGQLVGASSSDDYGYDEDDGEDNDFGGSASVPSESLQEVTRSMLQESGIKGSPMYLLYNERREDRMVVYADLDQQTRFYIYKIKAINKGKFTLPVVFAEALYNRDARANTAGGTIEIK